MQDWQILRGDTRVLLDEAWLRGLMANGDGRLVLSIYLAVAIVLMILAATTPVMERFDLRLVLLTAFGWPLIGPFLLWRALARR